MRSPIQTSFADLPEILPVFPLSGAMLLPWGRLPLNVFEPRYLNLVLDSLHHGRIFGMIQPDYDRTERDKHDNADSKVIQLQPEPALYHVGCAGRVSSFVPCLSTQPNSTPPTSPPPSPPPQAGGAGQARRAHVPRGDGGVRLAGEDAAGSGRGGGWGQQGGVRELARHVKVRGGGEPGRCAGNAFHQARASSAHEGFILCTGVLDGEVSRQLH